jgi:hypothetical protein
MTALERVVLKRKEVQVVVMLIPVDLVKEGMAMS